MTGAPGVPDLVIAAFGGLSKTARALGHKHVTTVSAWQKSGRIPPWRRSEILAAAKRDGVRLPAEFTSTERSDSTLAEPADIPPASTTVAAA